MKQRIVLDIEFVQAIPNDLDERTLYISIDYATVVHKCCCGCGQEVITPLSPTDWKLIYDGESVSLWPSIGNWNFDCQSHYWVNRSVVKWAGQWSREQIRSNRICDQEIKDRYYAAARMDPQTSQNRAYIMQVKLFWFRLLSLFLFWK